MTANQFAGHIAGQPYVLTREQFLDFTALRRMYEVFKTSVPDATERHAMWAAIAYWEAGREFNPFSDLCHSRLDIDTAAGLMRWEYKTTSGTKFECTEHREFDVEPAPGYPGQQCTDALPPGNFTITIPADRDHPGRHHYEQLRKGNAYCSFD